MLIFMRALCVLGITKHFKRTDCESDVIVTFFFKINVWKHAANHIFPYSISLGVKHLYVMY